MSKFSDLADKSEQNPSLSSSCFPNLDIPSSKFEPVQKSKKKFFEVFHKKKIIYLSEENKSQNVQYKCVYCNNIYDSMNRFEAHMKMHVRKILFNYYLINIFFIFNRPENNHLKQKVN